MITQAVTAGLIAAAFITTVPTQGKKPSGSKPVAYDVTIQADGTYTGTMDLSITKGAVSGAMDITAPTKIVGKVGGRAKGADLRLDFPYDMVERQCKGEIEMAITLPPKSGAAGTGTVTITGCGRETTNPLAGTIELKPRRR